MFYAKVLILIFLENALRLNLMVSKTPVLIEVLILIFLENALRHPGFLTNEEKPISLNPYFFGKCSTANSLQTVFERC